MDHGAMAGRQASLSAPVVLIAVLSLPAILSWLQGPLVLRIVRIMQRLSLARRPTPRPRDRRRPMSKAEIEQILNAVTRSGNPSVNQGPRRSGRGAVE